MTELKDEHLEVISKNKSRKYEIDNLVNQLSDAKESVAVLGNAIECGFLHDKHSLILQEWIVEYAKDQDQMETHLTEMQDHGQAYSISDRFDVQGNWVSQRSQA